MSGVAGKRGVCGGAGVMELVGQGESSLTGWAEGFGLSDEWWGTVRSLYAGWAI